MIYKYYTAIKRVGGTNHCDIIRISSDIEPTYDMFGGKYTFIWGGYSSMRAAVRAAMLHNITIDTPEGKSIKY